MNEHPFPGNDTPMPSLNERVDKVCDRFEAAWTPGAPLADQPRIEDYVGDTVEPERSALLRELLALELAYRWDQGDRPSPEEYRARFPDHAAVFSAAFQEQGTVSPPGPLQAARQTDGAGLPARPPAPGALLPPAGGPGPPRRTGTGAVVLCHRASGLVFNPVCQQVRYGDFQRAARGPTRVCGRWLRPPNLLCQ
jgi:hypothetical protein